MDEYAAAKARIFKAQRPEDFAVVNVDDPRVLAIARDVRARVLPLSTRRPLDEGGWLEGATPVLRLPGGAIERCPSDLPGLVGRHNLENALAAALAARALGVPPDVIAAGLRAFNPLAHRMTLVAEIAGVPYYDDSKGTNVGAVVAALDGFPRKVVLIAGGRDKGGSYAPLAGALASVGRGAVVIGEAAARIEEAIAGVVPVVRAASLDQAVAAAAGMARPGDAVVLSPACSSFDMFRSYEHRGDAFRAAVLGLAARGGRP
jgi:UDP-N-acetylmuramoylalanine--D-glutamate ligase